MGACHMQHRAEPHGAAAPFFYAAHSTAQKLVTAVLWPSRYLWFAGIVWCVAVRMAGQSRRERVAPNHAVHCGNWNVDPLQSSASRDCFLQPS